MNIEEIVARLRQTESRSKRKLLDEAADAIEELAKASIVKRIPCEVDPRKEYVELDGIRLVCEEGQIAGWYRPGDGLETHKAQTNADRIRAMSDEELAEQIYEGISSDQCDYCKHNNLHCDGSPCKGKADVETIIEWLQQPAEGE